MFEFSPQPIDDIQGDAHVELTIARAKRLTELTAQGLGIGARVRFRVRNMAVDALAGEVKRFDDDFHGIRAKQIFRMKSVSP